MVVVPRSMIKALLRYTEKQRQDVITRAFEEIEQQKLLKQRVSDGLKIVYAIPLIKSLCNQDSAYRRLNGKQQSP